MLTPRTTSVQSAQAMCSGESGSSGGAAAAAVMRDQANFRSVSAAAKTALYFLAPLFSAKTLRGAAERRGGGDGQGKLETPAAICGVCAVLAGRIILLARQSPFSTTKGALHIILFFLRNRFKTTRLPARFLAGPTEITFITGPAPCRRVLFQAHFAGPHQSWFCNDPIPASATAQEGHVLPQHTMANGRQSPGVFLGGTSPASCGTNCPCNRPGDPSRPHTIREVSS